MAETRLRELLEELHKELENADAVEGDSRHLLESALGDIQGVLGRGDAADDSIGERLREAFVDFETSHPQVAFAVERVMKALADMGI